MKPKLIPVLCLLLCLLPAMGVYADVAYEPDDNFYRQHWDECSYESRRYICSGSEGYVAVLSSPTGSVKTLIPNGRSFYVSWTWQDQWGCIEYDPESMEPAWAAESGWVLMSDMVPEYDSACFRADHAEAIHNESLSLILHPDQEYIGYKYPGSGIVTANLGGFSGDDYTTIYVDSVYTDDRGGRWGYVGYFFGHRDLWINLDTPDTLLGPGPEFTEPKIIPAADADTLRQAMKQSSSLPGYVLAAAGGLLLMAAAICAHIILKKKRSR